MPETTSSIADFCRTHRLRLHVREWPLNPNMEPGPWHDSATHWLCQLGRGRKRMILYYSQGSEYVDPPSLKDVLTCLHVDERCMGISEYDGKYTCSSFDEWCHHFEENNDSLKAQRRYRTCVRQSVKLRHFLGELYQAFLALEPD